MELDNPHNVHTYMSRLRDGESPYLPRQLVERSCHLCSTNSSKFHSENLRVACYNVLAQCYLEDNPNLYTNCPRETLQWSYRRVNIIQEIASIDADILCLQEVQADHCEDFFKSHLTLLGYAFEFQRKTGSKRDGVLIAFKSTKLHLVRSQPVLCLREEENHSLLTSDNVGLILLLEHNSGGANARICVATTHLIFNTRRGDLKLTQISLLLDEVDRLLRNQPPCPFILCGDFNSVPSSRMLDFLLRGLLILDKASLSLVSGQCSRTTNTTLSTIDFPQILSHRVAYLNFEGVQSRVLHHSLRNLRAAGAYYDEVTNAPLNTSFVNREAVAVDYMLYSPACFDVVGSNFPSLCLKSYWSLLTRKQLQSKRSLPNFVNSSDHIPLVMNFLWNLPSLEIHGNLSPNS